MQGIILGPEKAGCACIIVSLIVFCGEHVCRINNPFLLIEIDNNNLMTCLIVILMLVNFSGLPMTHSGKDITI